MLREVFVAIIGIILHAVVAVHDEHNGIGSITIGYTSSAPHRQIFRVDPPIARPRPSGRAFPAV